MFQQRLYQCPVLPPPCGFYRRFLTTMECWETLEKHSFPWLQTQRLWILLHTRKAKQYSFKMTTKTVSVSDGIRNARPCLPWTGFLHANAYLAKTWGKKMREINNKKNVLQTCCGLCIYVPYWMSDSLFPWTSGRLAGFDCRPWSVSFTMFVKFNFVLHSLQPSVNWSAKNPISTILPSLQPAESLSFSPLFPSVFHFFRTLLKKLLFACFW